MVTSGAMIPRPRFRVVARIFPILTVSGAAIVLSGCDQETRVVPEAATPVPTSTPTPTPAVQAATPAPRKADGLYLKRRISVTNDTGIYGFDAGTELKLVSRNAEKLVVIANDMEIEVLETDTTTELPAGPAAAPLAGGTMTNARQAAINERKAETAQKTAAAAQAAARQQRQEKILQLRQQIVALDARKDAIWKQTYVPGRDPARTPEGKARMAEMERIQGQIRMIQAQISQLRSMR
jgi:hypothetical protein